MNEAPRLRAWSPESHSDDVRRLHILRPLVLLLWGFGLPPCVASMRFAPWPDKCLSAILRSSTLGGAHSVSLRRRVCQSLLSQRAFRDGGRSCSCLSPVIISVGVAFPQKFLPHRLFDRFVSCARSTGDVHSAVILIALSPLSHTHFARKAQNCCRSGTVPPESCAHARGDVRVRPSIFQALPC